MGNQSLSVDKGLILKFSNRPIPPTVGRLSHYQTSPNSVCWHSAGICLFYSKFFVKEITFCSYRHWKKSVSPPKQQTSEQEQVVHHECQLCNIWHGGSGVSQICSLNWIDFIVKYYKIYILPLQKNPRKPLPDLNAFENMGVLMHWYPMQTLIT